MKNNSKQKTQKIESSRRVQTESNLISSIQRPDTKKSFKKITSSKFKPLQKLNHNSAVPLLRVSPKSKPLTDLKFCFNSLNNRGKTQEDNQNSKAKQNKKIIFDYEVIQEIGSGTFGTVFKVKSIKNNKIFAMKKVLQDPKYKNREVDILKILDHQNVLRLLHAFFMKEKDQQYLYAVMDYFPESLYETIQIVNKSKQQFNSFQLKLYSYQMLRGLNYIHGLNILHRDLKPHNILVNRSSNRVQICDFGSAKQIQPGEPNISYICSRCYRAPELIFGATEYLGHVDIWSLGCVIAEMINGHPLFIGESNIDQLIQIIKVLGTPSSQKIIDMNPDYDQNQNKFIQIPPKDIKKILKTNDLLLIDLLQQMFEYSPNKRITALQALTHKYFDDLRDLSYLQSLTEQSILIPDLFDFTLQETKNKATFQKLVPQWYMKLHEN